MPQIVVRKMHASDLDRVLAILAHWNMAPLRPSAEHPMPERTGIEIGNAFVAVADGMVVGVASYILHGDGLAETASLAVDPGWRGSGIGAMLQRARLAELRARGVLTVRTEADRPEVIDWYVRKFGYRIAGKARKRHPFSVEKIDEWTVLELDLKDTDGRKTGVSR
jgi:predicted N-acetyltransferase YhbS